MPRFVAEHTLPLSTEAEFLKMAKEMRPKVPKGYSWKLTYCDFNNHKFFCEWQAPSKEGLAEAFKANTFPFDVIHPVILFNAGKMRFED